MTTSPLLSPDRPQEPAVPYAFETIHADGGGVEMERLEAQNALLERHGLLDQLPDLPPGARILDVGSGTGYWSLHLARLVQGGAVTCLDRSPELLVRARARLEQAGVERASFLRQDLRELSLPPETFDLAFTSVTLVHVVEFREVLNRLCRALKPGGWIACFEPVQEATGWLLSHPPCPHLHWLADHVVEAAHARGSDFSVGFRIARHLERLDMVDVKVRYFGEAPHGEEAKALVRDVFLPIARAYLAPSVGPSELEEHLEGALREAADPDLWIDFKRTAILGRKAFPSEADPREGTPERSEA